MSTRILIIGSHGFIGKNAANYFASKGHEIFCTDIINKEEKNYTTIHADSPDYSIIFSDNKYDVCINASGAASVPFSIENPSTDFGLNVVNVFNILDAIRKYNPCFKYMDMDG